MPPSDVRAKHNCNIIQFDFIETDQLKIYLSRPSENSDNPTEINPNNSKTKQNINYSPHYHYRSGSFSPLITKICF